MAVLGFSYGGFLALEFALRHPDRLSHLLLMGTAPAAESAAYDVRPRLGEIAAPTLILAGRDDFVWPPSQARILADGIPGAELHMFEHSGHMPYVEEPEATFDVLRRSLARPR